MLVLSNADIEQLVTANESITWLEAAYRDLAANQAGNIPRADVIVAPGQRQGRAHYSFKTMVGTLPRESVTALRINSDVVCWPKTDGQLRRVKVPAADNRWVGLVMLFSNTTGEPLAIFPDGIVQRLRVGATNALAAKYLARPNSCTIGLLGSGWQAGGNLAAFCSAFPINRVRVYSPNEENRRRFAVESTPRFDCIVEPADSPQQAVEDADLIVCATNALSPVVDPDWLKPGVHLTCGKRPEVSGDGYLRCHVLVQHHRQIEMRYVVGVGEDEIPEVAARKAHGQRQIDWDSVAELCDLVSARAPGRGDDQQVTCFCNNVGMGLQFAAVGAHIYKNALAQGLGRELPTEWFTQDVHP